jgi:hypothetical protein
MHEDRADEDREFLSWRKRLEENTNELLRGADLTEARRWLSARAQHLSETEKRLIAASVRQAELDHQGKNRVRWAIAGVVVLGIAVSGAVGWYA